jgi:hypothetical protein
MKLWAVGLSLSGGYTVITRTTAFDPVAQTISWETCDGDQVTGVGTGGCSDPFNYRRKFVITETGLWKTDDLWVAGTPTWTQVATNNTIWGDPGRVSQKIVMSVNRRGFIGLLSLRTYAYSFDYGATWTSVTPPTGSGYANAWNVPGFPSGHIQMAERSPGVMFF